MTVEVDKLTLTIAGRRQLDRDVQGLLRPLELRAVNWLIPRLPSFALPDHLTLIGFLGALVTFVGYVLSGTHPAALWLASIGLAINWFGDSLDGGLARFRGIERERYGFYLDQGLDAFEQAIIATGMGLSGYFRPELIYAGLAAFFMVSLLGLIRGYVDGVFQIAYWGIGLTEVRCIFAAVNTALFFAPPNPFQFLGATTSYADMLVYLWIAGNLLAFIATLASDVRRLAYEDPPKSPAAPRALSSIAQSPEEALGSPPQTPVLLDISRILLEAGRTTPTGILRVEFAYAQHFIHCRSRRVIFTAMSFSRHFALLDTGTVNSLLEDIGRLWRSGRRGQFDAWRLRLRMVRLHATLPLRANALERALRSLGRPFVFIIVSQGHLHRPKAVRRLKKNTRLHLMFFVHDAIPSLYPEFDTSGWAARVDKRFAAARALADVVLVNSTDSGAAFEATHQAGQRVPRLIVAPLGVSIDAVETRRSREPDEAYFVVIGTIEPKKNHFFLLSIWRQLRLELGHRTPRLIVIGSRGWENENVVDLLDRSRLLKGVVEERSHVADESLSEILSGARALLLASFAEGYGLPLAEALALGVPAICSDLPALREVGGEIPEYLDPLDGPGWRHAIMDYMDPESPRRIAQIERLKAWSPPRWADHFAAVEAQIESIGEAAAERSREEPAR